MTIDEAMARQREAEAALDEAKKQTKAVALANYQAARDACYAAGVQLPPLATTDRRRRPRLELQTPEYRAKQSEISRAAWAAMSPEARAERVAKMQAGRRASVQ